MPEFPLSFLLGLEPEDAIAYLKKKGFTFSFNWQEVLKEAHTKAFTVAKVMRMDILQDIRNEMDRALQEGLTFEQFKKNLSPTLKTKGWWGKLRLEDMLERNLISQAKYDELKATEPPDKEYQLGSPWRLKTIYKVNLQTGYMAGRYKSQVENHKSRPYWLYDPILDKNTRPMHRKLAGKVFMWNDKFWDYFYPPNGFGCRCGVRALTKEEFRKGGYRLYTLKDVRFKADQGWNYNPGKSSFKPDLDKYDTDIQEAAA